MILFPVIVSVIAIRFGEFYLYEPCGFQVIEIPSIDSFVMRFNSWDADAEIGRVLRVHDEKGRGFLESARIMDAPAIQVVGPEGLIYYFDPKTTAELIRRSLADIYALSTIDAIMAGNFVKEPSARLKLLATGADPELVDTILNNDLNYVARSAFAEALKKYEVDRLVRLQQQKTAPPVRELTIIDRINNARIQALQHSGNICYALRRVGLAR